MFQQMHQLLTFQAFRPKVDDVKVPLMVRLKGQSAVGVVLSRRHLVCSTIRFNKDAVEVSNLESFVLSDKKEKTVAIRDYAASKGLSQAVIFTSPEFEAINLEKSIDYQGNEKIKILSEGHSTNAELPFEDGRSCTYIASSKAQKSLWFSYSKAGVQAAAHLVENAGLKVLRLTCGVYTTLSYLMSDPKLTENNPLVLIHGSNALFLGVMEDGWFRQIGFRSKICFREFDEIIPKVLERFGVETQELRYVNFSDWNLKAFFEEHYPQMQLNPIFEDCKTGWIQGGCHG